MRDKVFFIGPPKTGSKSYAYALSHLGWNSLHNFTLLHKAIINEDWDFFKDSQYNAFFDGLQGVWEELLKQFPTAKFILPYRNPSDIAFSKFNHALNAQRNGKPYGKEWPNFIQLVRYHENFYTDVFKYVIDNQVDNILICRIDDGWKPLCDFLKVPEPNEEFPHCHKGTNLANIMQNYLEPCPSRIDRA